MRLILYTTQGRGSAQLARAYEVRDRDHAQEVSKRLQSLAVVAGEEPVRCTVVSLEDPPQPQGSDHMMATPWPDDLLSRLAERRDPDRIGPILKALSEAWSKNPDLRIGQIISNLAAEAGYGGDLFYIEDDLVLEALRQFVIPEARV